MSNHELGSARESQAELAKKRLFLIYRDNELFQAQIAPIREALASSDYQVIEQSFPAETTEQEIATWAQSQADQLRGVRLLTDETFARSVPRELRKQFVIPSIGELDQIMEQSAIRAVFGPGWAEHRKETGEKSLDADVNLDKGKELFIALARRILEDPKNRPESVVILKDHLSDHYPLKQFYDQAFKKASEDDPRKAEDEYSVVSKAAHESAQPKAAELLGHWVQELDISESQIKTESIADKETDSLKKISVGDKTWVIHDRHASTERVKGGIHLEMPLADFFLSASKSGLLRIPVEELQRATGGLVRERFAKGTI
ncbi:MAG TPA: hypothetical protein VJK50_00830 [Patescibacteria group bacterium]|nr:hypothetical protein [Patescibacteria group bacterium]